MSNNYPRENISLKRGPSRPNPYVDILVELANAARAGDEGSIKRLYEYVEYMESKGTSVSDHFFHSRGIPPPERKPIAHKVEEAQCKKTKIPKGKARKIVCAILAVLLLFLSIGIAIIYHNRAITKSYNEGFEIGKTEGYDEGFSNGKKEGYKNGYSKGNSYYEEVKDEYWFFRRNACITTNTGENYHLFGCYHIEGRPFKIYDKDTAQAKGYTFCSDCLRSIILD